MFVKAIENNIMSTRALLTARLFYKNREIINGISSLIVLNAEGDILTCAHVADLFLTAEETNEVYLPILKELKNQSPRKKKVIENKYGIKEDSLVGLYNIIADVASNLGQLNIIKHPTVDLAIIRLESKDKVLVTEFPSFRANNFAIGERVCKLGYAFPEFDTFYYDENDCQIKTHNKVMHFPIFPHDAMVTRNIVDTNNEITMFEISTPCLPGQSGGPIFDDKGAIGGIQIGTKRISSTYNNEMAFNLDLGIGINVTTITDFLDENQIKYNKAAK